MTMQNFWRPLGLCALAAALCIGVPAQAHADNFRMEPGTQLVARNDQQGNWGKSADARGSYKKDAKAAKGAAKSGAKIEGKTKAKNGGKAGVKSGGAKGKTTKGAAKAGKSATYAKNDVKKDARPHQAARATGNKGQRGEKAVHPGSKPTSGAKAARSTERTGKRPESRQDRSQNGLEGQRRSQQHNDGDVTN